MPYRIKQSGEKWQVVSDADEVMGDHDTEEEAKDQLAALYANVEDVQKGADMERSPNLFIPIAKVNADRREVWGWGAVEEADNSDEVMDYASSKPLIMDWSNRAQKRSGGKSKGNVRAMHQPIAAGKIIDIQPDDNRKGFWLGAKITDDNEWRKVIDGVYTGFSIGGSYVKRWMDPQNPGKIRYTAKPNEWSIVDAPCIPSATFDVVKADGTTEVKKFHPGQAGDLLKLEDIDDEDLDEYGGDTDELLTETASDDDLETVNKSDWEEGKHPRGDDGKFSSGGGGGSGGAKEEQPKGGNAARIDSLPLPGATDKQFSDAYANKEKNAKQMRSDFVANSPGWTHNDKTSYSHEFKHENGKVVQDRPGGDWMSIDKKHNIKRHKSLEEASRHIEGNPSGKDQPKESGYHPKRVPGQVDDGLSPEEDERATLAARANESGVDWDAIDDAHELYDKEIRDHVDPKQAHENFKSYISNLVNETRSNKKQEKHINFGKLQSMFPEIVQEMEKEGVDVNNKLSMLKYLLSEVYDEADKLEKADIPSAPEKLADIQLPSGVGPSFEAEHMPEPNTTLSIETKDGSTGVPSQDQLAGATVMSKELTAVFGAWSEKVGQMVKAEIQSQFTRLVEELSKNTTSTPAASMIPVSNRKIKVIRKES